ncbi:MAG: hypothetical protein QXO51_06320 [Halobacteria archaeon]
MTRKTPGRKRPLRAAAGHGDAAKKVELIRRELTKELDEGLAYVERQVGTLRNGPIGLLVSPLLRGLFHFTALPAARRRGYRRMDIYFRLLQEPGSLDRIISRHLDEYLETNEAWVRADKSHPEAKRLRGYLVEELKSHLELGRALLGGEGRTYDELVRRAFPRRSTVDRLVAQQFDAMEKALLLVQEAEGLVEIPASLRAHVDRLLRSALAYARTRSRRRLDKIYAG